MKIVKVVAILLALIMLLPLGCQQRPIQNQEEPASDDNSVIRIGVNEPLTGANESGGNMELQGIQLAYELYPQVLGREIELVVLDNQSDMGLSAEVATQLIEGSHVNAIIGAYTSSLSIAAGPIIQEAQIPTVGGSCTNPLVTQGNDYYFRVCFIDPFQGTVMADYAYNQLKSKTAVVVYEQNSDYSVGLAKNFTDSFMKLTGKADVVLATLGYSTGDRDFSQQVAEIATLKPDMVFAPGNDTESAMLIKQARSSGIVIPFLGGDTWETKEFVNVGGSAVEGVLFSSFYNPQAISTPLGKEFLSAYRKKYGTDPSGPSVNGFDAYMVLRDAIERAKSAEPNAIKRELAKTTNFQGAGGAVQLDEERNAIKPAVIMTIKDGRFRYLQTIEPQ